MVNLAWSPLSPMPAHKPHPLSGILLRSYSVDEWHNGLRGNVAWLQGDWTKRLCDHHMCAPPDPTAGGSGQDIHQVEVCVRVCVCVFVCLCSVQNGTVGH